MRWYQTDREGPKDPKMLEGHPEAGGLRMAVLPSVNMPATVQEEANMIDPMSEGMRPFSAKQT